MSSILEALRKLEAEKAAKSAAEEGIRVFEPQTARTELLTDAPEEKPRNSRRFPAVWVAAGASVAVVLTVLSSLISIAVMRSMAAPAAAPAPTPAATAKDEIPKPPELLVENPPAPAVLKTPEKPSQPAPEEKTQIASIPKEPKAPVNTEFSPLESEDKPTAKAEEPSRVSEKPEEKSEPIAETETQPEIDVKPKKADPVLLPPLPAKEKEDTKPSTERKEGPEESTRSPRAQKAEPDSPLPETETLQTARTIETPSSPSSSFKRESPRFSRNKVSGGSETMASRSKASAQGAEGPVNLDALPVLRGGELGRYGLENMHINVLREAGPDRPYAVAIINLSSVYVGDMVPGTQVKLIGVRRDGIGVQIPGTDERFFVEQ